MWCNAVLAYLDEYSVSFNSFRLPTQLISNPANKSASSTENWKEYVQTDPKSWAVLKDGEAERTVGPIPYTGAVSNTNFSCDFLSKNHSCTNLLSNIKWFSRTMGLLEENKFCEPIRNDTKFNGIFLASHVILLVK